MSFSESFSVSLLAATLTLMVAAGDSGGTVREGGVCNTLATWAKVAKLLALPMLVMLRPDMLRTDVWEVLATEELLASVCKEIIKNIREGSVFCP